MKNEKKKDVLRVSFWEGGRFEHAKTGIYPRRLYFDADWIDKRWTRKVKKIPKKGTLKMDGVVVYVYHFTHEGCEVTDSNGDPVESSFSHVQCD